MTIDQLFFIGALVVLLVIGLLYFAAAGLVGNSISTLVQIVDEDLEKNRKDRANHRVK